MLNVTILELRCGSPVRQTGTLIHEMHVTQIHVINNHWGKFQMRLCALSSPSAATEASELSDACLDQVGLSALNPGPSPHRASPHLTSPHRISHRLTSSHLASPSRKLTAPLGVHLQNKLQLADGSGLWTYPKAARSATIIFDLKYRLPPKVTCERCILQACLYPRPCTL